MRQLLALACVIVALATACGRVGPPVRSYERERRSRAVPTQPTTGQPADEQTDEDSKERQP